MFELERKSVFFEKFSNEYPTIVQNIEIIYENKIQLDASYHHPKHFILFLNNLLRSLLFFIEYSLKNTPSWLKYSVLEYKKENSSEYQILKYLRNISAHQKFILPEESIVTGLYRIHSIDKYQLKLGFGDFNKPRKHSLDLTLKNTEEIFHDVLVFESLAYMDLDHSSLGECLGVTRRWFYKVKFKNKISSFNETIDVYKMACVFSSELLDKIIKAYENETDSISDIKLHYEKSEFNNINTLLEMDLYPSLFSHWWGDNNLSPLNFGVNMNRKKGEDNILQDKYHSEVYNGLSKNKKEYKLLLNKYKNMPDDEIFGKNIGDFYSFISLNHWYYKKAFKNSFGNTALEPTDIMMLQRYGKIFMEQYSKKKECTIKATSQQFKNHLEILENKI